MPYSMLKIALNDDRMSLAEAGRFKWTSGLRHRTRRRRPQLFGATIGMACLLSVTGGCNRTKPAPQKVAKAVAKAVANPHQAAESGNTGAGDDGAVPMKTPWQAMERPTHGFPPLSPLPPPSAPPDNPITLAKSELGKLLFFDDRLSGDVGTSCASCHDPRQGWGDGNALSRGYAGTQHWRNSQTTINTGYLQKLFWAGEAPSLEAQAVSAIKGNLAGNGDDAMIEERLMQIPEYVRRFDDAFGAEPNFELIVKAIATFERDALVARNSPFDQFLEGDEQALDEDARRGLVLFEGKAKCIRCHHGALLSDENYHSLGVPESPLFQKDPLRQIAMRYQHFIRGVPEEVYRDASTDLGLYYTTKRDADRSRFRTPPLRYLAYTAPYMHNGALETLEDVIDFYDAGGGDAANKSPLLEPLGLTDDEKEHLLFFLESLSGREVRIAVPQLPAYEAVAKKGGATATANTLKTAPEPVANR